MILPSNYWRTLTFTFYTFLAKPNNFLPCATTVIDDIFPSEAFFCSVYVLHVCHTDGNWLVCIVPLWRCIVHSSVSHLVLLSIFHITFSVRQYIINTITTIYCDARYYCWSPRKSFFQPPLQRQLHPVLVSSVSSWQPDSSSTRNLNWKPNRFAPKPSQRVANIQLDTT